MYPKTYYEKYILLICIKICNVQYYLSQSQQIGMDAQCTTNTMSLETFKRNLIPSIYSSRSQSQLASH